MKYITHKRFKAKAICGEVNIPAMTECEEVGGFIVLGNNILCAVTSENAHQYFAQNEDGQGMARGKLTQCIQNELKKRDKFHDWRWGRIWADIKCKPYKRKDHADYWLWNHEFFNAPVEDLIHIFNIIDTRRA